LLDDEYDAEYEYHQHGRSRASRAARPDPYAQTMGGVCAISGANDGNICSPALATDPAWQNYLLDFYRHHGYYPTYEQLHRMWLDQQQASVQAQVAAQGRRLPSVTGSSSVRFSPDRNVYKRTKTCSDCSKNRYSGRHCQITHRAVCGHSKSAFIR